ncbi:MAG: hypothetical protein AAGI54_04055 [Planctomycetota bacterium]
MQELQSKIDLTGIDLAKDYVCVSEPERSPKKAKQRSYLFPKNIVAIIDRLTAKLSHGKAKWQVMSAAILAFDELDQDTQDDWMSRAEKMSRLARRQQAEAEADDVVGGAEADAEGRPEKPDPPEGASS